MIPPSLPYPPAVEITTAHGVQITTRRFGGHEIFAYRELGRRAIVALSGIQAPNRAYGKTNGEGNTMEVEDRRLNGWKEIQSYIGLDKDTIIEQGYPVRQLDEGCSVCYASSKLFQG